LTEREAIPTVQEVGDAQEQDRWRQGKPGIELFRDNRRAGHLIAIRVFIPMLLSLMTLLIISAASPAYGSCLNEAARTGPSANLPDCRAYELVTPPDTNGRLLESISTFGFNTPLDLFPTNLSSPSGGSLLYMTLDSPLVNIAEPAGTFDLYEARRLSSGWSTARRVSPSGQQAVLPIPGGVSKDHQLAFTNVAPFLGGANPGGSLAAEGTSDYLGKPDGSFELTGKGELGTERFAQGRYISEGGTHVIFTTGEEVSGSAWCFREASACEVRQLELKAPATGTGAVYDRSADGPTYVVSLLPGEVTPDEGEDAEYQGTSADGSTVAFKVGGTLYVRIDNATTKEVTSAPATFAGISADGERLFYLNAGNIHVFDVSLKADVQVNSSGDADIVNVSADGSHVYFISPSQLDGSEGSSGDPNMYVWSGGSPEFIATVLPSDLNHTSGSRIGYPALTNWTDWAVTPEKSEGQGPGGDSSRSTPDGNVLVFESRAQLTEYETDGHTGIYRYDDQTKSLQCVSCNPLSEPAVQDARLQNLDLVGAQMILQNVTDDGSRVYFETTEALDAQDIDGVNDIYQWHEESFGVAEINLISSGKSTEYLTGEAPNIPTANVLLSVTPDGRDVFFLSQDQLVASAGQGGPTAIYDARIGGGFSEPSPAPGCVEEGCHLSHGVEPALSLPKSVFGAGNVKPRAHHRHRRSCKRAHRGKKKTRRHCARKHRAKRQEPMTLSLGNQPGLERSESFLQQPSEPAEASSAGSGAAKATASAVSSLAGGEFDEFGIKSVDTELTDDSAGAHPDFVTRFALNHHFNSSSKPESYARTEDISVSLPPGLMGNPNAIPKCSTGQLVAFANCPTSSQVGITEVTVSGIGKLTEPIYNLEPPHPESEVARLGFFAHIYPVFIDISVRTAGDYGVTATVQNGPGQASLLEAKTILWGDPSDPSHDEQRLTALEAILCPGTACKAPEGKRPSGLSEPFKGFMTNPSACQSGTVGFQVSSYQLPGQVFSASAPMDPITGCQGLPFQPSFSAEPTSHVAGAPTGLRTKLVLPQHLEAEERATATMREARVTLPEGMQIAAGAANWIGTCSEQQVGLHEEVEADCPDASKLGTARIVSPSLSEPIEGAIYQRTPAPGHQFGLWLVVDALGLHIKLPGELEPDKESGRLTAVFRDLPQVPVEEIDLNIWGGERAPLQNPSSCGTYATDFSFAPHSNDPVASGQSQMQIDAGCNQGFSPTLYAGVEEPVAGHFSSFIFSLLRNDGEQALRGFELHLPDGELAKLKGVPLCADDAAAAGGCPGASRIGSLTAVSGPGPDPLLLPQPGKAEPQIFLAGPYKGAPYSIVTEVPAQAGPFDLGVVVVRSALDVDPETAQVTVEADPLPQFFEGVGIAYRRLHAVIDRPNFSLNPTDCREMAVASDVTSMWGAVAHPAARFQVDGCRALKFKPRLSLKLRGGTERGDYPSLEAVVKARKGDANIGRVSVALPHSEFLAQEHIATICTRKRFAEDDCPKGSIYGKAKAWTPLLDKPLQGPVYLRSSDNPLPDLVMAMSGELDITLVGRIDSKNGGIRTTFDRVPDAPITKFVLRMKGGAKSLLVNSQDICLSAHRATVRMGAQNGRALSSQPRLQSAGCGH
jgi:hypothetical protein